MARPAPPAHTSAPPSPAAFSGGDGFSNQNAKRHRAARGGRGASAVGRMSHSRTTRPACPTPAPTLFPEASMHMPPAFERSGLAASSATSCTGRGQGRGCSGWGGGIKTKLQRSNDSGCARARLTPSLSVAQSDSCRTRHQGVTQSSLARCDARVYTASHAASRSVRRGSTPRYDIHLHMPPRAPARIESSPPLHTAP